MIVILATETDSIDPKKYKSEQMKYKKKTALNKRVKEADKRTRKDREDDTMAMLNGFRGALFEARKPKTKKDKSDENDASKKGIFCLYGVQN